MTDFKKIFGRMKANDNKTRKQRLDDATSIRKQLGEPEPKAQQKQLTDIFGENPKAKTQKGKKRERKADAKASRRTTRRKFKEASEEGERQRRSISNRAQGMRFFKRATRKRGGASSFGVAHRLERNFF